MKTRRAAISLLLTESAWRQALAAVPTPKSKPWDREIVITGEATTRDRLVALLSKISSSAGLIRKNAAPGLDELRGRRVIFHSFGTTRREVLLTITNMTKEDELVVWGFYDSNYPMKIERILESFKKEATKDKAARIIKDTVRS